MGEEQVYPGPGAVAFANQYIEGLGRAEALTVITQLHAGNLHDVTNRRIKRCDYCQYIWNDDSLRNTKRTCSDECKRAIKTLQRRQQRADQELLNPKPRKHTLMDDYVYWLEYPYWIKEYSMIKIGWRFERPMGVNAMSAIDAKSGIYGKGNSRKPRHHVSYDGDDFD